MDLIDVHERPIVVFALTLPLVLLGAHLVGQLARWLLRGRVRLSTASTIVVSVLGISLGLLIGSVVAPSLPAVEVWIVAASVVGTTMLLLAGFAAVASRLQPAPAQESVAAVIEAGESSTVEFKSSARWNLHSGKRDEAIELVIAKTVASFLNADGGTLLIGVDDSGTMVGLARDFALVKNPDPDRYELWLRDLWASALGRNAAALPAIDFTPVEVDGEDTYVCRVRCVPSPQPVYVRPSKKGAAAREFWVRSGNSTRQLQVNEAVEYVMHHWPLALGPNVAAQMRAAARGTRAGR